MEASFPTQNKADKLPTAPSIPTKALSVLQTRNATEKDVVGSFLIKMYNGRLIQPKKWTISKATARSEFQKFIQTNRYYESNFANKDIEILLRRCGFVSNQKGSNIFSIVRKQLLDFRQAKLKQLDTERTENLSELKINQENEDVPLVAKIDLETEDEAFPVVFQGGCEQQIQTDFVLTTWGCFICQQNFQKQSDYEDHVAFHGFDSDFEFLSKHKNKNEHIFDINYRLCKKSHFFSFTMETKRKDIIIEKIIIVQSNLMQYVNNNMVPYEIFENGTDTFLLDSHLFTIGVEQPIVVIYRRKSSKLIRYVEQHHFLRTEEFPQVHFSVKAYRLPQYKYLKITKPLREYEPFSMLSAQKAGYTDSALCGLSGTLRQYIEGGKVLSSQNCCDVLKYLLQIEDLEGSKDYASLRQSAAQIKRFGQEYSVRLKKIPNNKFLENILSPLDEIVLIESGDTPPKGEKPKKKKKFHAIVERVYLNQVCFKYDKSVICERKLYDIVFRPSRLSLKYQYRALEMLSTNIYTVKYLYPDVNFCMELPNLNLTLFNTAIEKNPEQLQAVQNIANGPGVYAPYIIFGPPGTGKTSTIVEAVLQLWKRLPLTRILITAGSNGACDEVAIRLCRVFADLDPGNPNILRLFAKSNEKRLDSIDDVLIEASNFCGAHFYPAVEIVREYRIIVCTLAIVGKLVTADIGNDFFTHVFVDECAASTESEVLVSWMGTSSSKTRLIISGDHKQLGPIIKSKRACELGLNQSFMERLINQPCYKIDHEGNYDRSIQTRLVRNFRSHPEIVRLYNNLYYDSQLKPMAKEEEIDWTLNWHFLPNKKLPIIFHSVYGSSRKMGFGSSLCNEDEVNAVIDYVKELMYFGLNDRKIEETDIGIISPYKKQYTRIQEELNRRRWHQIEVGAVETFQGKEKSIIIVSTVRSFTKSLGFLDDPRRLNVILSRPKALLIIIGNPTTLSQNKDFKYIIDECQQNRCKIFGPRQFNPDGYLNDKSGCILKKTVSELALKKAQPKKRNKGKQNEVLNTTSITQTEKKVAKKELVNKHRAVKTQTKVTQIEERLKKLKLLSERSQLPKNAEALRSNSLQNSLRGGLLDGLTRLENVQPHSLSSHSHSTYSTAQNQASLINSQSIETVKSLSEQFNIGYLKQAKSENINSRTTEVSIQRDTITHNWQHNYSISQQEERNAQGYTSVSFHSPNISFREHKKPKKHNCELC